MKIEIIERPWGATVFAGALSLMLAAGALAVSASPVSAGSDKVVATVGNHKITESEVDQKIKPQMESINSQIFDLKRKAIDAMVEDYLMSQAAKKEGLTLQQYVKKEVIDKTPKVTDADAKKYYDAHKGPGTVAFDKIKNRLVQALQQQALQNRQDQIIDALRKQNPVKVLLKTPRMTVASSGHPSLGPANAPITIVEFGDFQCPFCRRAQPTIKEVMARYPKQVRLVYMDFPLPFHNHALDAAKAARCAGEQGKFWQYHDRLFADQAKQSPADLKAAAKQLGLNTAQFDSCFEKAKYQSAIESDVAEGRKLGVDGTPSFYIDGRPLVGAQPFEKFQQVIEEEMADKSGAAKQARAN
jgi:protein-disulfide isomerase